MENKELREKISKAIAKEFEKDEETFELDAELKTTLDLDSLSMVDLVALVEQKSGVTIGTEDVKRIKTFKDLFEYIESHVDK